MTVPFKDVIRRHSLNQHRCALHTVEAALTVHTEIEVVTDYEEKSEEWRERERRRERERETERERDREKRRERFSLLMMRLQIK